ncbi:MAG: GNAT family N-acetyltransferase [Deltaproteobacteria bacterium]
MPHAPSPTPDLHIRFARISEREGLEALQLRASLVWREYRAALLAHPEAIAIPVEQIRERRVRIAERSGRVVGFAVVIPLREGEAELDALFVEPGCMHAGTGRALVVDVARLARRRGARSLFVMANPYAKAFYAKVGFVAVGRAETAFGPAVRMRMALANTPAAHVICIS